MKRRLLRLFLLGALLVPAADSLGGGSTPPGVAQGAGAITPGNCAQWSASGILIDAGGTCGTGTAGVSQAAGTANQILVNGLTAAQTGATTLSLPNAITIGTAATATGSLTLNGLTSGAITVQPQSAAGTYNFNLPITAGAANAPLLSGGGGSTPMAFGTLSGNTTKFATTTGTLTSGNCVQIDASGNFVQASSGCASPALTSAHLFVGNGSNVATDVALSGDATLVNTGAITVTKTGGVNLTSASTTALGTSGATIPLLSTANTWTLGQTFSTAPTLGSITGSTQCLHVNTSGVVSGTGADCGAGGGSVSITALDASITVAPSPLTGTGTVTIGLAPVAKGGTGLTSGTSGGVLAYTASGTLASSGALTASNPVIGGGAGVAPSSGSRSGNTTVFATTTGALTSGNCVKIDASGNLIDATITCGGSGAVSVTAGTPNVVVTPTPGTGTFTVGTTAPILAKVASYTVVTGDQAKLITMTAGGATTLTLPQAGSAGFSSGWAACFVNLGAGTTTISTTTSTINGLATSLALTTGGSACLASDGANWDGVVGGALTGVANTWSATQTFGTIGGYLANVVTDATTARTLAAADCGTFIKFTNAGAVAVTVPATLTTGCQVAIEQDGAGQVSVNGSAVTPATLHSAHSYTKTFGQYAVIGITINGNAGGSSAIAILTGDGA